MAKTQLQYPDEFDFVHKAFEITLQFQLNLCVCDCLRNNIK